MKIKKSELVKIIKEEALKFKKALELKKELANVEKQLNEVKAGDEMNPGKEGVHAGQKKAVFATKGNPALKMEDGDGDENIDATPVDAGIEGSEEITPEMDGKFNKEKIKAAIENLEAELGLSEEGDVAPIADDNEEDIEFDEKELEGGDAEDSADESSAEEGVASEEEGVVAETAGVEENKPATEEKCASTVDDGMEKDKHVKESVETIAEAEKKRMSYLAGIIKG